MTRRYILGMTLWLAIGCGGTSGIVPPEADSTADADTSATTSADTSSQDTGSSTDLGEEDAQPFDVTSSNACEPGEGCFGESCTDADDCLSGICTMHLGDKVCSKTCDANCPQGWTCNLVGGAGSDGQYVCLSNFSHLCLPCETSEGCSSETPTACVAYGDGLSFCGGACDLENPCPSGYSCQQVENTAGVTGYQCVSTAGVCQCSNLAIESGLATPCATTNEFGTCEGVRACTQDGLSTCDAATPAVETCNGIDDDCNGLVDEGTCDDGNGCTTDTCAGSEGCTHTPLDEGECLDGDACTVGDHCEAGTCVGLPVACDDANPCTKDTCDGLGGCTNTPTAAVCDDGDDCTLGDLCTEGTCAGSVVLACDDGNLCTDDLCGEGGCVYTPSDQAILCDDGNACTTSAACQNGSCVGTVALVCDDGEGCTTDSCDPATGCVTAPNTLPCDDSDTCTLKDTCANGTCQPGATPLPCADGNPCTDDGCDKELGCVFLANNADCDDKNECTTKSTCSNGACLGIGSLTCDDGNPCTTDSCLPEGGCTHKETTGGPCNDGNICTTIDICNKGQCKGGGPLSCDDGNECTDDSCDPTSGCVFEPNQALCSDNNPCTTVDVCNSGSCVGAVALVCDDGEVCTSDVCNPQSGCEFSPTDAPCSDADPCTVGDSCEDGTCQAGALPLGCDDANPCTDDICIPGNGCGQSFNQAPCDDGNICTEQSTCSGGSCQPGKLVDCDDGAFCNGQEVCDPQEGCIPGKPLDLTDDIACTVGVCDEETDTIAQIPDDSACGDPGLCKKATCSSVSGCSTQVIAPCCGNSIIEEGEVCDDGNKIFDDACDNACQSNQLVNVMFTPCGKTGPTGPNQSECNAAYFGNPSLNAKVTIANGIQIWKIPVTGTYRITAVGAQGGTHSYGAGGRGAKIQGDFKLTAGTVLKILVGQRGKDGNMYDVGGGGGTFVAKDDNTPVIVAGGGGAHGNCSSNGDGMEGSAETGNGNGGGGSNDGNYCGCGGAGSAGGGFQTDGQPSGSGRAFVNGGEGGTGSRPGQCVDPGWGGFGGGGNGGNGGGGGGGYQGGDGGGPNHVPGFGGKSYNSGNNPVNATGINKGDGWVTVNKL